MSKQISRYPIPKIDDLPEDIREIMLGAQENLGFIPNVLLALANRPAELRAFLAFNDAFTKKESGLTPKEREMMIVAFSSANGCTYCVMSHGAALRGISGNPYITDQVSVNYHEADITPREKAIIDFAMKVSNESFKVNETDFETLKSHGLSDDDIWDIAGLTAFYNYSNRMMSFLAVKPDEQYYSMGR